MFSYNEFLDNQKKMFSYDERGDWNLVMIYTYILKVNNSILDIFFRKILFLTLTYINEVPIISDKVKTNLRLIEIFYFSYNYW